MTLPPQLQQIPVASVVPPVGLVCGIDEAGYGPLLGPLVVSKIAFEAPIRLCRDNWWTLLRHVVCDDPAGHRAKSRLPVCDSKRLHTGREKLAKL